MQDAIGKGDARRLGELIRQDPGFNVNKPDGNGITFLHFACMGADSRSAVIPLLLAHPNIEVNSKSKDGETPFYYACYYGQTSSVPHQFSPQAVTVLSAVTICQRAVTDR